MLKLFRQFTKKEYFLILIIFVLIFSQVWLELKMPDYMSEITKLVQTISINSLGIYLFSYLFDYIYYQRIIFHDSINRNLFYSLIIMTPLILLSSLLSSIVLNKIIEITTKRINYIRINKESQ